MKKVTELAKMTKNRDYMTECEATSHAVNVKLERENKKLKDELARKDAEIMMQKESGDGGGGSSVSETWKDHLNEANRKYLDERKKGGRLDVSILKGLLIGLGLGLGVGVRVG